MSYPQYNGHPSPIPQQQPIQQQQQQQQQQNQQPLTNKLMMPPTVGMQQFMPPGKQFQMQPQPTQQPPAQPQLHSQFQNRAPHLTNGGSNASSRTASPALNQSFNVTHLPPRSLGGPQYNTLNSTFLSSQQPNNVTSMQNSFAPIQAAHSTQNLLQATSPPPSSTAAAMSGISSSMQNISLLSTMGSRNGPPPQQQFTAGNPSMQLPPSTAGQMIQPVPLHAQPNVTNGHSKTGPMIIAPSSMPPPSLPPTNFPPTSLPPTSFPSAGFPPTSLPTTTLPPATNLTTTNDQQFQATPKTFAPPQFKTNALNPPPIQPNQVPPHQQNYQQPPQVNDYPQLDPYSNNNPPPMAQQQYGPPPKTNQPMSSALNKRPAYPQSNQQPQYTAMQQQPMQPPQPQSFQPNQMNQQPFNNSGNRLQYQNQTQQPATMAMQPQPQPYNQMNVTQHGFNRLWGQETVDLMQHRHILPATKVQPPSINLEHEFHESINCSPDIIRSTLTKVPESNSLLQKSRLPFGILIHPFKDLNNLPVIQCSTIVRCRSCRTYINPFVYFVDSKKWKCNLCYRVNEIPEEFQYDPVSKSYGDVTRRPEVKSSTIEFIAPSEYMLRPPQPAIYLFLLDVSMIAQQSGYLQTLCDTLIANLDNLPGDVRTQIGFIAYDSAVHFYSIADGFGQPHEITIVDIDDIFLPFPDNLLINLKECRELITDLLKQLPTRFMHTHDSNSALGAALQVAFQLMKLSGGRVTVFQTCLPNKGPGALQPRENPNDRSAKDVQHLGPATDFYKRLALECSGQQIAVDVFLLNSQYSDLATISGISKFSSGCIHHFPLYNASKPLQVEQFTKCLERYFTRKIGFESVMRVRCTRGLAIHTFHGNFFVRSTDLLSLPNVNPDAGYGMQISYEESLSDLKTVCFQAALLYTSSKGERRIRVHTLCLPVSTGLSEIIHSADVQAIIGLISKMAVDRSLSSNISDARDAFINASTDVFSAFRLAQNLPQGSNGQLMAPKNLSLLPLYMMALLKHIAFRTGTSTRLDDRVFAMCELKSLPLDQLIRYIYPDFYLLDGLFASFNGTNHNDDNYEPPLLQLSAERIDSRSVFLMDCGLSIMILVGSNVPPTILTSVFDVSTINEIPDLCLQLPNTGTSENDALQKFIDAISVDKPYAPTLQIIRDTSPYRSLFVEKLVDDRAESSLSYYEFLQHLRTQVK